MEVLPPLEDDPTQPEHSPASSLLSPDAPLGEVNSSIWGEAVTNRRIDNKQRNEAFYERIRARAIEMGGIMRVQCKERYAEYF
ncbi:hypothetical protein EON65_54870 [archaeon]|nr:MAG: hypothetical protein EON65_54870 [archaeon]